MSIKRYLILFTLQYIYIYTPRTWNQSVPCAFKEGSSAVSNESSEGAPRNDVSQEQKKIEKKPKEEHDESRRKQKKAYRNTHQKKA